MAVIATVIGLPAVTVRMREKTTSTQRRQKPVRPQNLGEPLQPDPGNQTEREDIVQPVIHHGEQRQGPDHAQNHHGRNKQQPGPAVRPARY